LNFLLDDDEIHWGVALLRNGNKLSDPARPFEDEVCSAEKSKFDITKILLIDFYEEDPNTELYQVEDYYRMIFTPGYKSARLVSHHGEVLINLE
jgi:hypothetical protein